MGGIPYTVAETLVKVSPVALKARIRHWAEGAMHCV